MNELSKKVQKYPQVQKHFINTAIIEPDFVGNWNYQPPVISDKPLRRLIRGRIQPFNPAEKVEQAIPVNPAAKLRKVIDFALASLKESDKRRHCTTIADMCQRIADCRNAVNMITADQLYTLYEIYNWTCPKTGIRHSIRTPLSIEFKTAIWQGGRVAISNVIPVYNGTLPGEYHFIPQPEYLQVIAA